MDKEKILLPSIFLMLKNDLEALFLKRFTLEEKQKAE